ncbi:glycosyltransferase family 2 protein [Salinicoccus roseus]|uniref:glycosyltransferase family 2 protein n=1 Tax=Salinicoccus roseus TaxID=45670 RepID=UPI000F506B4A|nr:glycosyltransferase [Salinicoccus roseus]RPE54769.1 glycosyl transferase family 2 [Salinicoccus roseus]GGA62748.1 hypothetical protein GCM10007176_04020 [Salinicoccus roseus]
MKIEVSFITTVKNAEVFIKETIESVQKQTLGKWEYIIVDDGSTDNTIEVVKSICENDNRIKLITTGGIGRGKALNLAIENTSGKYIANIDVDDPSHPQRAQFQKKFLDDNREYSLSVTQSIYIVEDEKVSWELYNSNSISLEAVDITTTRNKPFRKEAINHSSVMFKKSDLINIGKYDESRSIQFDAELFNRFSFKGYKIALIPMKLATKRMHSNQSFEAGNRVKYLASALELNKNKIKFLNLPPVYYVYIYILSFFMAFYLKS